MAAQDPITKIVRFIFDRLSAQKVEQDAKKTTSVVDKSLSGISNTAKKVAASIAGIFALNQIRRFGQAAIEEFTRAENSANRMFAVWQRNAGAVGRSFEEIAAFAKEVRDTTLFDSEEIELAVAQLLTYKSIAGDTFERTIRLATDLASAFGGVESSTQAIAKALDDPVQGLSLLRKQNFTFSDEVTRQIGVLMDQNRLLDAQSLILATLEDEMGGVAQSMRTGWVGAQKAMRDATSDFMNELGKMLVEAGGGTSVMDTLTGVFRTMTAYIAENQTELQQWVNTGIVVAANALNILWRVLRGLTNFIVGTFGLAVATFLLRPLVLLLQVNDLAVRGVNAINRAMGGAGNTMDEYAQKVRGVTAAFEEFLGNIQSTSWNAIKDGLSTAFDFSLIDFNIPQGPTGTPRTGRPMAGGGAGDEESEATRRARELTEKIEEIWKNHRERLKQTETMSQLLGDEFEEAEARLAIIGGTIEALVEAGLNPMDEGLQSLVQSWLELKTALEETEDPIQDALDKHTSKMDAVRTMSVLLGEDFDHLNAEISSLTSTLSILAEEGLDPTDERMRILAERLKIVQSEAQKTKQEFDAIEVAADAAGSIVEGALGAGIPKIAAQKAKMNMLEAVEHGVRAIVAGFNPLTATQVPVHLAAAKKHAALAAAWGALAGGTGGFGGGGAGGGGGGAVMGVGGSMSERARQPSSIVNVYFDPLDPHNPRAQMFVNEAQRQVQELHGQNAEVQWFPYPKSGNTGKGSQS